jgi:hypothetical protein
VRRKAHDKYFFTVQKGGVWLLPCVSEKTHGKVFAVRFLLFAVRPKRTAKAQFPVVSVG